MSEFPKASGIYKCQLTPSQIAYFRHALQRTMIFGVGEFRTRVSVRNYPYSDFLIFRSIFLVPIRYQNKCW